MRLIWFFIFFLFFILKIETLNAQELDSAPDTVYVSDTIVNDRVVEKVVYVYRAPSNYLAFGISAKSEFGINSGDTVTNIDAFGIGGGIQLQFHKKVFMSEMGLNLLSRYFSFDYTYKVPYSVAGTYTKTDTLSKYYETINNITYTRFITKQTERDTVYHLSKDSAAQYSNKYKIIQLPVLIGFQKAVHFFSIECKAGVMPSYIVYPDAENTYLNAYNSSANEKGSLNRFSCDLILGLGVKYLLTVNSLIHADLFYQRQLTNTYNTDYWNPKPQALALNIGVTFILKEKDK